MPLWIYRIAISLRFKLNDVLHADVKSDVQSELKAIIENGPVALKDRLFLINGWRWHTKSVLRDISRFANVIDDSIQKLSSGSKGAKISYILPRDRIVGCHNFVINFNWKALMRVEREIFFPWLQELLPNAATPLVQDILSQHREIQRLSQDMGAMCDSLKVTDDAILLEAKLNSIRNILSDAKKCALNIQRAQVIADCWYLWWKNS